MMRPYDRVECEYIKPLIEDNLAQVISKDLCNKFNDYISTEYPWHKINLYRIDWDKIGNYQRLPDWIEIPEDEITKLITEFLKKTCLRSFSDVCIIYGADEPGLFMTFDLMCKNLEALSAHVPLTFFIVGTKKSSYGIIELEHRCFVEMDMTKHWLTAPIIKDKTLLP